MASRLRSLDSKISFFAFADIITAVSGMLIFITLLLATDLDQLADTRPLGADSGAEQKLQTLLRQQAETEAQTQALRELLTAAETAPSVEKLESDIVRLRSQLAEEQEKQTALSAQAAANVAAIESRDKTLGLSDLKANTQRVLQEVRDITAKEAKARSEMRVLEQQVWLLESRLLKLRAKEGQIWLIPDKSATSKQPILVTVSGTGILIERFDQPAKRKQLDRSNAESGFKTYLKNAKPLNDYVVFEVRPSGIELFQALVKSARDAEFEVGFDALDDQTKQIHFESPPTTDDNTMTLPVPPGTTTPRPAAAETKFGPPTNSVPQMTPPTASTPAPASAAKAVPPQKSKSWWRRFLEWIGLA